MVHSVTSFSNESFSAEFFEFKMKRRSSVATSPVLPFKQSCIPELRYVSVHLHDDVTGILTYFDNIHGQLEKLTINGFVYVNNNGDLSRLADLRQWLAMSSSPEFTFEMNVTLTANDDPHVKTLLTEYGRVTGNAQLKRHPTVNILYPVMSLIQPEECNDEDSSDEPTNEDDDNSIDANTPEVRRRRKISISDISCLDFPSSTLPNRSLWKTNVSRK